MQHISTHRCVSGIIAWRSRSHGKFGLKHCRTVAVFFFLRYLRADPWRHGALVCMVEGEGCNTDTVYVNADAATPGGPTAHLLWQLVDRVCVSIAQGALCCRSSVRFEGSMPRAPHRDEAHHGRGGGC